MFHPLRGVVTVAEHAGGFIVAEDQEGLLHVGIEEFEDRLQGLVGAWWRLE